MRSREVSGVWEEPSVSPFNEMMISWNGQRPSCGQIDIYASVLVDRKWSHWLPYASWGSDGQKSYDHKIESIARVYQDAIEVLGDKQATGFRIQVTGRLWVHVYTNEASHPSPEIAYPPVQIPLRGLSQMALPHERHKDLCSPTSVTAVVRHLSKRDVDPVQMAEKVRDHGFDIFGNWVLNVAEGSHHLGPAWHTWVERLQGFGDIHKRLSMGTPVIVSVRGPLPGGALPYARGHLLAVTGFDPEKRVVECMDPAFATDEATRVSYQLDDFLAAWGRRGHVAYVFEQV